MALYINRENINQKWRTTQYVPFGLQGNPEEVVQVAADGDELIHIAQSFKNVPLPSHITGHTQAIWYGDMAKFIVANL